MQYFLKYVMLICLSIVASCSDWKLRYLGYTNTIQIDDPKIDYSYAHKATTADITPDQVAFGTRPPNFEGTIVFSQGSFEGTATQSSYNGNTPLRIPVQHATTHTHYLLRDYSYAVFCPEGYVSECDMEKFKESMQEVTRKDIRKMMAMMCRSDFVYDVFSKAYLPMVSHVIQDKVKAVKCKNIFSDLAGWQIFKPTEGIDKEPTLYKVEYQGNGWYDIFLPKGNDTVSVKIMYTGKYLNPVIVGVKNQKMNVDVIDTSYKANVGSKMWGFSTNDKDYMFLEYLCPIIYKETGRRSLVTEADFDRFTTKVNERRMAFVRQFYNNLLSSDNNLKKLRKSYFHSLPQRLVAMADSQIAKKDNRADMFLPCSYREFAQGGYDVTYLGKDWYQVTAPKSSGNSLKLKVVLYGPWVCPAIMGIKNPIRNVNYCPQRFSEE